MANEPTIDMDDPKLGIDTDASDMDILNTEDPDPEEGTKESKKPKVKPKVEVEGEPEVEDKEEVLEEDDENPDEEEDDDIPEDDETEEQGTKLRPSLKVIIKEFPEAEKIFKKYPQLRDAYYREGKFSQLFTDLEDASEASEKAASLDAFNEYIMGGSSKELLKAVGQESPSSLKKLAEGFLPTLQEINPDLFYDAAIPIINTAIRNLYAQGLKNKDNNSMSAAKIMANFFHQSYDIPDAVQDKKDPAIEQERQKLDKERNDHEKALFTEFDDKVNTSASRLFSRAISEGLDPTNSLSEFTKSKIIEEVIDRVGNELKNDRAHTASMQKLWKLARTERFSSKSAERIITAYLSRAKQLIPEIRSKVKNEALGKSSTKKDGTSRTTRREMSTGTRNSGNNSRMPTDPKKVDKSFWRKNSDADILKG